MSKRLTMLAGVMVLLLLRIQPTAAWDLVSYASPWHVVVQQLLP